MMRPPTAEYRSHPPRGCSGRLGATRRWPELPRLAASVLLAVLAACSSTPPAPDWQMNAKSASERSTAAYLAGNARIDATELARARAEVARTGRADLLARVELAHCAAQVASLVPAACSAFEALRPDVPAAERAYADYLAGKLAAADAALLPEAHRAVANNPAALQGIADPLSRQVAAGVLFASNRADPQVITTAIETASAQGWRRPLLAWLTVQLKRTEAAGASDEAERLRRRIVIVGAP